MKVKIGDTVKITAGREKGKTGKIKQVFPDTLRVVIENLNLYKRRLKPRQTGGSGKTIEKERPLPLANIALICPGCHKATRVGYMTDKTGAKLRLCRKCKKIL